MVSTLLKVIKEGSATVNFPKEVFYNPVQEFNRDLTISVINHFNRCRDKKLEKDRSEGGLSGLNILEALSATGLRSIRFAKEIPNVNKIIANDIDPIAADLIKQNIDINNCQDKISVNCGDANLLMYQQKALGGDRFHVVDIDPYGSASRFLDAAVQSLTNGGLLCVTCTDAAVLCGASSGTSMGKYGAVAIGSGHLASSHEQGIRILLHSIQSAASRHGLYIEPLLSLSIDFYFRVFVRVLDGAAVVKAIATKLAMLLVCVGCHTHHLQPLATETLLAHGNRTVHSASAPIVNQHCAECGGRFVIGGPLWAAPIHSATFCAGLLEGLATPQDTQLATRKRIVGMVTMAAEELANVPLYYEIDRLARTVKSITPPTVEYRSALLHAGYRVSSSHCSPVAMKTDAPPAVLWAVMRAFMRRQPMGGEHLAKLLADERVSVHTRAILAKCDGEDEVNFERHPLANPKSRVDKLLRFQANPLPNWGPKPKASKFQHE